MDWSDIILGTVAIVARTYVEAKDERGEVSLRRFVSRSTAVMRLHAAALCLLVLDLFV